jgi:hypothetical protein
MVENFLVRRNAVEPGVMSMAITRIIPTVWIEPVIVTARSERKA